MKLSWARVWVLLAVVVLSAGVVWGQSVVGVAGRQVTVSVGLRDGVRVGMTGTVTQRMSVGGREEVLEVARFVVEGVQESRSTVRLTEVGGGFTVGAGDGVVFDQALVRPTPAPEPRPTERPRATPTPRIPSDPMELDRLATAAYEAGRWSEAIELYRALLARVPGEPLATRRLADAQARIEAERAAAEEAARRAAEDARRREEVQRKLANADYLLGKGDQMMAAGEWELAAQYYAQVAEVDPVYADSGVKRLLARGRQAVAARDGAAAREVVRQLDGASVPLALAGQARELRTAIAALAPLAGEVRRFAPSDAAYAYVPAGSFTMGCVASDTGCDGDEKPAHRVTLSRGFWMKTTEVTVGEYRVFAQATGRGMPSSPGFSQSDDHPVVKVDWNDAEAYCRWAGGRLPSEAEWEYAARGGREGLIYPWGNGISHENANYGKDECCGGLAQGRDRWVNTSPVGSFAPNGFGLYDMAGNVWEWCADWYDESYYASSPSTDPRGPSSGTRRVLRGGSWGNTPWWMRVSYRRRIDPSNRDDHIGFRCLRDE